jgi:hypothetical protein
MLDLESGMYEKEFEFPRKVDVAGKVVDVLLNGKPILIFLVHKPYLGPLIIAQVMSGLPPNQPDAVGFIEFVYIDLNSRAHWHLE